MENKQVNETKAKAETKTVQRQEPKQEEKHTHKWVTAYKTVTVPAVTKTVHHDAVYENRYVVDQPAYEEPIYESHYVSTGSVTGEQRDFGNDFEAVTDWCAAYGDGYTVKNVQVGTKTIPEVGHNESV